MNGSTVWLTVALLGVGSTILKASGPVFLGGRELPPWFLSMVQVLAPALLAALIATQAFAADRELVLDARAAGLGAAFLALLLRAPTLAAVALAAVATALVRAAS